MSAPSLRYIHFSAAQIGNLTQQMAQN